MLIKITWSDIWSYDEIHILGNIHIKVVIVIIFYMIVIVIISIVNTGF
jgi:hypothetical protein